MPRRPSRTAAASVRLRPMKGAPCAILYSFGSNVLRIGRALSANSDDPRAAQAPVRAVFLVGMMGAGKTTVGRRLARRLGWAFVDADRELEARLGVPVATIFELEGEAGFRQRESALIEELTARAGLVLATGGGAVLDPVNRRVLHERGRVVYLRASVGDLWHRLRRDKVRPLLRTADPRARIEALVALRDPLYREAAHAVVDTGRQPIEDVVDAILSRLPPGLRSTGGPAPAPVDASPALPVGLAAHGPAPALHGAPGPQRPEPDPASDA
jgi:shikimate kinase